MGRMKAQGALMFNMITEGHKVLSAYQRDPPDLTLRHDDEDIEMLPYAEIQVGFFMLLCRGQKSFADDNFTYVAAQGHELEANRPVTWHASNIRAWGVNSGAKACHAALAGIEKHRRPARRPC